MVYPPRSLGPVRRDRSHHHHFITHTSHAHPVEAVDNAKVRTLESTKGGKGSNHPALAGLPRLIMKRYFHLEGMCLSYQGQFTFDDRRDTSLRDGSNVS